jgi:hypothetical protein
MFTEKHDLVTAKVGEKVTLSYDIKDHSGNNVDVSTGVTAAYKMARRPGGPAILTIDSTISFSGHTINVSFNTNEVVDEGENQLTGDFFDQLTMTKAGDSLVVSEGPFTIEPVIT